MDVKVWANVQVAIQTALAAPKTITAISKANPAVVESTAHGFENDDLLLLRVRGMRQLDWAIVRVANKDTDDFELDGIDSTLFKTFASGTAQKMTFGAEAETLQNFTPSGGESAGILAETIHTDDTFEVPGRRTPLVVASTSIWDPRDPALIAMNGFDAIKTPGGVLLTFPDGDQFAYMAFMSAPLHPGGDTVVTTPISHRVRGRVSIFEG